MKRYLLAPAMAASLALGGCTLPPGSLDMEAHKAIGSEADTIGTDLSGPRNASERRVRALFNAL